LKNSLVFIVTKYIQRPVKKNILIKQANIILTMPHMLDPNQ